MNLERKHAMCDRRLREALLAITFIYIFCSFFWLGRQTTVHTAEPLAPLRQLWFFFGLDQDWRLFGPQVRTFNGFPSMIITAGGAKLLWEPPRQVLQVDSNPFRLNLHRKFSIDYLPWAVYKGYWSRFTQTISQRSKVGQLESVSLLLNSEEIPDFRGEFCSREREPRYGQRCIYFRKVEDGRRP